MTSRLFGEGFCDNSTKVMKRVTVGGGGVKIFPNLRDDSYGWPLSKCTTWYQMKYFRTNFYSTKYNRADLFSYVGRLSKPHFGPLPYSQRIYKIKNLEAAMIYGSSIQKLRPVVLNLFWLATHLKKKIFGDTFSKQISLYMFEWQI